MSDKCYTPVIAGYGNSYTSVLGKPIPNAHPSNCKHECPYGKDRAFCFPCYVKIMNEHRAARKAATEDQVFYQTEPLTNAQFIRTYRCGRPRWW